MDSNKKKKKDIGTMRHKIQTAYDMYLNNAVNIGPYTGIPSIAARHTAIEYGTIQLDAGHVPREIGMNKLLILITHFHNDHGSDICNCIGHGNRVTIFVPAYCAYDLFLKIKADMSMRKGRSYTDDEIVKMVRIIGCKRNNDIDNKRFDSCESLELKQINGIVCVEFINIGDIVSINLKGRERVAIEAFACYHTIDTCGYVIYNLNERMVKSIKLEKNTYIDVNFTEDQNIGQKKKSKNTSIEGYIVNDIYSNYDWKKDDKFRDVVEFSERHVIPMYIEYIDNVKTNNFTLRVRRLHIPEGMELVTKDSGNKCVLTKTDITFLKKYKINISIEHLVPDTMFFGDTCSYVFDKQSSGYTRVMELLENVSVVIIESTFLESINEMGRGKYINRIKKKHMFLFELYQIFEKFPRTKFLLIHFSACYDRNTIIKYIDNVNQKFHNVTAFI